MATSLAAAVPHAIPIQQVPRIRPPRFLKGQPRDIDIPQPGPPPVGHGKSVWVQGEWRSKRSNAVADRQKVLGRQVEKAVRQVTHGCSIYAYYHLRTNQVVYSTTRIMQPGQIMPQLIFHGKKTVPSGLRRDVWRPYYSIHFPQTDAGARLGLDAYRRLRQLSLRRQLDPDPRSLLATQADVDKALKYGGDPLETRNLFTRTEEKADRGEKLRKFNKRLIIPTVGQKLPLIFRAKKLMDQKATSVADAAHVLGLAIEPLRKLRLDAREDLKQKTEHTLATVGRRAQKTLKYKRAQEEEKSLELVQRRQLIRSSGRQHGSMLLDRKKAEHIALEFDGTVTEKNRVVRLRDMPKQPMNDYEGAASDIRVLWADIRDGLYASSWVDGIVHGELQPLALHTRRETEKTPSYQDRIGTFIPPHATTITRTPKTVHVHGRQAPLPHVYTQQTVARLDQPRQAKDQGQMGTEQRDQKAISLIPQYERGINLFQQARHARLKQSRGELLTPDQQGIVDEADRVDQHLKEIETMQPVAAGRAKQTVYFRQTVKEFQEIQKSDQKLREASQQTEEAVPTSQLDDLRRVGPELYDAVEAYLQALKNLPQKQRTAARLSALEYDAISNFIHGLPPPKLDSEPEAAYIKRTSGVVVQGKEKSLWKTIKDDVIGVFRR